MKAKELSQYCASLSCYRMNELLLKVGGELESATEVNLCFEGLTNLPNHGKTNDFQNYPEAFCFLSFLDSIAGAVSVFVRDSVI